MELPWSDDQAGDQRLTLPYYRYRYQRSQNMLSTIPPQKPHVEPPHEPQTFFGFLFVTCFSPNFIPFWIFITESLLLHFLCYIFGLFQTFPIWQYLPIIWLSFIGSLFTITFVICILGGTFLVSFNLILNTSTIPTLCVHFLNTHSWGRSLLSEFPFIRGIDIYGRNLRFRYLHRISRIFSLFHLLGNLICEIFCFAFADIFRPPVEYTSSTLSDLTLLLSDEPDRFTQKYTLPKQKCAGKLKLYSNYSRHTVRDRQMSQALHHFCTRFDITSSQLFQFLDDNSDVFPLLDHYLGRSVAPSHT